MQKTSVSKEKGKLRKCHKCGYGWLSKTKLVFASCPSCNAKVREQDRK